MIITVRTNLMRFQQFTLVQWFSHSGHFTKMPDVLTFRFAVVGSGPIFGLSRLNQAIKDRRNLLIPAFLNSNFLDRVSANTGKETQEICRT